MPKKFLVNGIAFYTTKSKLSGYTTQPHRTPEGAEAEEKWLDGQWVALEEYSSLRRNLTADDLEGILRLFLNLRQVFQDELKPPLDAKYVVEHTEEGYSENDLRSNKI